ncbi:MAG: ABC transporter permease [Velocimicrobium sp.]
MKFKINPVYKKELKISVRTIRMAMIILGYNVILGLIGILSFFVTFEYSYYNTVKYSGVLEIYLFLAVIEFGLVLFVVPAFTSSAISGEREKQTLEILLTTKLKPSQIIVGKLLSSISSTLLLVFSSLPILALVFSIGGIRLFDLIQLMIFCTTSAVFIGSIGIFFSTCFKKTVPSTVFTYGCVILLIFGTLAVIAAGYIIGVQDYDKQFYASGATGEYSPPGVGSAILLLLINPAASLLALVSQQFGSPSYFSNFLLQYGTANTFVFDHWYGISILTQLVLAAILLLISIQKLNPLKSKSRRHHALQ